MKKLSQDADIRYIEQGDGPVIILVHGMAGSSLSWAAVMPALVNAGYRVIALDLIGHGDSHKPSRAEHYHVQEVYRAFEDWIDTLDLQQPFYLVGHSLGGHLSLQYCLNYPERLGGLVLLDPFYSQQQLIPGANLLARVSAYGIGAYRRMPENLFHAWTIIDTPFSGQMDHTVRRQIAFDLKRAAPEILHILPSVTDLIPELANIQSPTLIIYGSRDLTLRPASFQRLASLLPNAVAVRVPETGHQPHITKPEVVNSLVIDFLKQNAA